MKTKARPPSASVGLIETLSHVCCNKNAALHGPRWNGQILSGGSQFPSLAATCLARRIDCEMLRNNEKIYPRVFIFHQKGYIRFLHEKPTSEVLIFEMLLTYISSVTSKIFMSRIASQYSCDGSSARMKGNIGQEITHW